MKAARRVAVCSCLAPVPFKLDRGVTVCDSCGDILPSPGVVELKGEVRHLSKRLQALETAPPPPTEPASPSEWLSIKQCALEAGQSYEAFRRIRERYGFEPGAITIRATKFRAALRQHKDGDR